MILFEKFEEKYNHKRKFYTHRFYNGLRFEIAPRELIPYLINLDEMVKIRLKADEFNGKIAFAGCQGVIGSFYKSFIKRRDNIQKEVAESIKQYMIERNYQVLILLGDNFYMSGVDSVTHQRFKTCFEDVYLNKEQLKYIVFSILGNHDYAINSHMLFLPTITNLIDGALNQFDSMYEAKQRIERALWQVERTYLPENEGRWNMPYRYYALVSKKVDFFIIDSNTFPFDIKQQKWLCDAYILRSKLFKTVPKILIMHHPLISHGYRVLKIDEAARYRRAFSGSERNEDYYINPEIIKDKTMEQVMFFLLRGLATNKNIRFNAIFSSHDHLMALDTLEISGRKVLHVTSGGGGSDLEKTTNKILADKTHANLSATERPVISEGGSSDGKELLEVVNYNKGDLSLREMGFRAQREADKLTDQYKSRFGRLRTKESIEEYRAKQVKRLLGVGSDHHAMNHKNFFCEVQPGFHLAEVNNNQITIDSIGKDKSDNFQFEI